MPKALTVKSIEAVKPASARREIPDGVVSGLYLVAQPSGKKSWAVRYRVAGTPRKFTIGAYPGIGLKDARALASAALVEVAGGNDPGAEKKAARAADTGDDIIETIVAKFVERHAKPKTRKSTWVETERVLNKEIVERWRRRRLADITRADVHNLLDSIVDRDAPALANRTLALFRTMCGWAVQWGIITTSPCDRVKPPAPSVSRDRILSDAELKAVWNACDELGWPFGPFIRLLILTGSRRSEVAEMTWAEIDFETATWVLPKERAKNNREHTLPLSDAAIAILRELPHTGDFVFSCFGSKPITGFQNAKNRLGGLLPADMQPWTLHDLRRTAASGMARLGVNVAVVERVLNHVSGTFKGVVGVYQRHDFADEKRRALESWAAHVLAVAAGEDTPANVVALRG
jgi:integrase